VVEESERVGVDWRTAAQAVAIRRVGEAARLRAIRRTFGRQGRAKARCVGG
jgi:hypothetical protein